jgi:hypothetical protein
MEGYDTDIRNGMPLRTYVQLVVVNTMKIVLEVARAKRRGDAPSHNYGDKSLFQYRNLFQKR